MCIFSCLYINRGCFAQDKVEAADKRFCTDAIILLLGSRAPNAQLKQGGDDDKVIK